MLYTSTVVEVHVFLDGQETIPDRGIRGLLQRCWCTAYCTSHRQYHPRYHIQATDGLETFLKYQTRLLQASLHIRVVCVGNLDELASTSQQRARNNPRSRNTWTSTTVLVYSILHFAQTISHVFLDLGLFLALCWLVDGHLDDLVGRGHDNTTQF
jgi:hypothetical protein